jgi:hypothetical protein
MVAALACSAGDLGRAGVGCGAARVNDERPDGAVWIPSDRPHRTRHAAEQAVDGAAVPAQLTW